MSESHESALRLTQEQEHFSSAAEGGVLALKRCRDTGRPFWYPRAISPFTGGATEWMECLGSGEVYSCSVTARADPPYCIAYVRLDEGPIILTNIVAEDLQKVSIGQRVKVLFRPASDGRTMPFFTPVTGA
jgi:uncharacterized protein